MILGMMNIDIKIMSGEAFDRVERRIYDIIERVEREIEQATCERTPLVTETGVAVKERIGEGHGGTIYAISSEASSLRRNTSER